VVHGALVALRQLKPHGGALINVGSVVSDMALPTQGMYSATKHAVKGFTDALRMELEAEVAPVSVTLIKPHSIDTPFPQHARNYMERGPKLPAQQQRDEPPRAPEGALWLPGTDGAVRGDQPGYLMKTSLYTRALLHPVMAGMAVAGAGLAAAWLIRSAGSED
jgi:NAD(P)-dependent dehydrogenase (short-subunit alcohol dehydrogenase family)